VSAQLESDKTGPPSGNQTRTEQKRTERPKIWRTWAELLSIAWRSTRAGGVRLLGLMLLFHAAILALVSPLLGWMFRQALRANGMVAFDPGNMRLTGGFGVTLALILLICILAFWIVSLQFAVIVITVRRSRHGLPLTVREVMSDLGRVIRKLLRPSSLPLVVYLFVLVPLTGFGFTTVLAQGIAVPSFISGELMKEQAGAIAWILFMLLLAFLNLRFALTVPVFVLTDATGGRAMRVSWRITRGRAAVSLLLAVATVTLAAAIATFVLVLTSLVPTAITDEVAPDASPIVAAFSLGAAQLLGLLLTAFVTAMIAALVVAFLSRFKDRLPEGLHKHPLAPGPQPHLSPGATRAVFIASCVAAALGLGIAAIPTMQHLSQHPSTVVLAHRGFTPGGVENTLCSLEAAAEAGADLVEMDVMQTKDGRFIVMHDANLARLAGKDVNVKDLTFDELTAMTVSSGGYECAIPSLAEYATRAAELDLPLLIEIKLGGADTPDHVQLLIEELESLEVPGDLNALERNIYHTLDAQSVTDLKIARPDLTVGYIMAFAGGGIPDTPADFVVIEEWSATESMQSEAEAAGLGFLVWTVNEEQRIREHLRRNTHGIITDIADIGIAARVEMSEETGLADTLVDALTRFVVVF